MDDEQSKLLSSITYAHFGLEKLKEPFEEDEIEWRVGQCGKKKNGEIWATCLAYVSARAIQDRLDKVCGPENWKVEYVEYKGSYYTEKNELRPGIVCRLSINCKGVWVTKEDGADQTETEAFKGGLSSAFKRAGSSWGLGRYLYNLESGFATIVDKSVNAKYGKTKEGDVFYWHPPKLPAWALPKKEMAEKPVLKNKDKISKEEVKTQGNPPQDKESPYPDVGSFNDYPGEINGDAQITVGQYTGTTFKELFEMDRASGFKYIRTLHSQILNGKSNFHEDYKLYYSYAKQNGALNV